MANRQEARAVLALLSQAVSLWTLLTQPWRAPSAGCLWWWAQRSKVVGSRNTWFPSWWARKAEILPSDYLEVSINWATPIYRWFTNGKPDKIGWFRGTRILGNLHLPIFGICKAMPQISHGSRGPAVGFAAWAESPGCPADLIRSDTKGVFPASTGVITPIQCLLSTYLSIYLSVCLSIYLSLSISIYI